MTSDIAIIGAGNLGAALAVHLRKQLYTVLLAATQGHPGLTQEIEQNDNQLTEIDGKEGIEKEVEGVTVSVNTGGVEDAVCSNIIFITVPVSAQEDIIKTLAQHNLQNKTLIFMPCGIAAGLIQTHMQKDHMPEIILGTVSSPYASHKRDNGKIAITRVKNQLEIASTKEISDTQKDRFANLFPSPLVWYQDLASIFISNVNPVIHPVIHPATMLISRELIVNSNPKPLFYEICMNNAKERISDVDKERCSLADAMNLKTETLPKLIQNWYTPHAKSYNDSVNSTPTYKGCQAPPFQHRYLTEDVKYLMVLMHEIAAKYKVKIPNITWIINEAVIALGENLCETGTTLKSLGLENATPHQITQWINGYNFE